MKALTVREINIAKQLVTGASGAALARACGCNRKTIQRLKKAPHFAAFVKELENEREAKVAERIDDYASKLTSASIDVIWTFNDAAVRLKAITDDPKAKNCDKISAIKLMGEMYRVAGMGPIAAEARPNVYRSKWMKEPVQ